MVAKKDIFKPGERIGLVLCSSNVALEDIAAWRTQFGV
jgi:threonine dehydratase